MLRNIPLLDNPTDAVLRTKIVVTEPLFKAFIKKIIYKILIPKNRVKALA